MNQYEKWVEISSIEEKNKWVQTALVDKGYMFPYECYYPFPSSWDLFENELDDWRFFENNNQTRFFILKTDQKKYHYLHLIYPWDDIATQVGIWETVQAIYDETVDVNQEEETYIWIDLTKEEANRLSKNHPFTLPSPWVLHGVTKDEWENMD